MVNGDAPQDVDQKPAVKRVGVVLGDLAQVHDDVPVVDESSVEVEINVHEEPKVDQEAEDLPAVFLEVVREG